jgi:addiction module HigA family antidote
MNNIQIASKNQYVPDYLVTPSEVLNEYLEYAGLTQASLADRTGLSKKTINEIVKAKSAITAETALRFGVGGDCAMRFYLLPTITGILYTVNIERGLMTSYSFSIIHNHGRTRLCQYIAVEKLVRQEKL